MNPSLFSFEGLAGLLFLSCIACTLAGALIATNTLRLIRAVAGLAMCFVGLSGVYMFLGSPFVALMQLLIYVGAVCTTIIFAVMLAETKAARHITPRGKPRVALAVVASFVLAWALIQLGLSTEWPDLSGNAWEQGLGSVENIGKSLLTTYSMSFELISVVLLAAIVGSLALARAGRHKS